MSFIPPILRFFNVIPSNLSKGKSLTDKQALIAQTKTTSFVLLFLQYLKLIPSDQTTLDDTRPVTPESNLESPNAASKSAK